MGTGTALPLCRDSRPALRIDWILRNTCMPLFYISVVQCQDQSRVMAPQLLLFRPLYDNHAAVLRCKRKGTQQRRPSPTLQPCVLALCGGDAV